METNKTNVKNVRKLSDIEKQRFIETGQVPKDVDFFQFTDELLDANEKCDEFTKRRILEEEKQKVLNGEDGVDYRSLFLQAMDKIDELSQMIDKMLTSAGTLKKLLTDSMIVGRQLADYNTRLEYEMDILLKEHKGYGFDDPRYKQELSNRMKGA